MELTPQIPAGDDVSMISLRHKLQTLGVDQIIDVRLVQYLISQGRLRTEALEEFIAGARAASRTLSQQATRKQLCDDQEIFTITANVMGWGTVNLDEAEIEADLTKLLSPAQAEEWQVLPYSRDDLGVLLVAIADPDNIAVQDNVKRVLKEEIAWHLTSAIDLQRYITIYYDPEGAAKVAEVVGEMEGEAHEAERIIVRTAASEDRIVRLVDDLIGTAQAMKASDIHIDPGEAPLPSRVRMRVDGIMSDTGEIPREIHGKVIARIKTVAKMRTDERLIPQDGHMALQLKRNVKIDLRIVTLPTVNGEKLTMRLLDPETANLPLESLGMNKHNLERFSQAISLPHGCAFVTGPTGSGKSTTLYSALQRVASPDRTILTVEDPVEYRMQGITQMDVSQSMRTADQERRFGFDKALRSMLRADPDVIMVGEVRDESTARIAIEAALTGHYLFSTLHTNTALSAITRLEQLGVPRFLLAEAIEVIVSQRLVRRLCPECKQPFKATAEYLEALRAPSWAIKQVKTKEREYTLYHPNAQGCISCGGRGYKGRTGVHEVIAMTPEIRTALKLGKSLDEVELIARKARMPSLADDAFVRAATGSTSMNELARVTM